jgi:hypothetical protein
MNGVSVPCEGKVYRGSTDTRITVMVSSMSVTLCQLRPSPPSSCREGPRWNRPLASRPTPASVYSKSLPPGLK